ncbi:MAG: class I SAM-dependent methyltransferase [Oscillospiraceae bacterium]|nr:class I SAM-dependent methyltransferase [Oscillospiraceae bacterium]
MLDSKGFDLWANDYDKSVGISDEEKTYPFAGYKDILNAIYCRILSASAKKVLDIGFGTGTLSSKLYENGCMIFGQDFSENMIEAAQKKMPDAKLFCGDFSKGLLKPLTEQKYDAIVATYSLHHLTDGQKEIFIKSLVPLLNDGGSIYIGDVAFSSRTELEKCRNIAGEEWDEDEIYFVFDEIKKAFPKMRFEQFSACAGLLSLEK